MFNWICRNVCLSICACAFWEFLFYNIRENNDHDQHCTDTKIYVLVTHSSTSMCMRACNICMCVCVCMCACVCVKETTCYLSKRSHEAITARVCLFLRYVFFDFLVHFRSFWAQNRSEVWFVPINRVWKLYLKRKPQHSLFLWLTSGLGKSYFLGPKTPRGVYLKTFTERNNLIYI